MSIDWSKAPEGATHAYLKKDGSPIHSHWVKVIGRDRYFVAPLDHNGEGWRKDACPVDLDECIAKPPKIWNGEGLPPVGTICQFFVDEDDETEWHEALRSGMKVEVIAHFTGAGGSTIAAFFFEYGGRGNRQVEQAVAECFRPLPTPEQIAAEEREAAINGMLCYDALGNSRRGLAEALYDAGYRKQEAP